jgi:3-deoxy-manno-octulosonate cytidylyltransferase (CMP-KDO synthetase)
MTPRELASGTDRVASAAEHMPDAEIFVNLQGDEPEVAASSIDRLIELLADHPDVPMATLASPIRNRTHLGDPACVKVVCDGRGRALYFSRSVIPHAREWDDSLLQAEPPLFLQHIGLYAYRPSLLQCLRQLPASALEKVERLEQLRALQAGYPILVGLVEHASRGIDTAADYRAFVQRVSAANR